MGGSLWVIWLAVASLTPAIWTSGPQSSFDLLLLVPLSLLAAQTIADFVNRRVKVSALVGLVPATILCIALWASDRLAASPFQTLIHGRADAATALGLHLVLDVIVISLLVIRWLNRWARAARQPAAIDSDRRPLLDPLCHGHKRASRGPVPTQ